MDRPAARSARDEMENAEVLALARLAFQLGRQFGLKSRYAPAGAAIRAAFMSDNVQERIMVIGLRTVMDRHPELNGLPVPRGGVS